jgi:hypothetical protein
MKIFGKSLGEYVSFEKWLLVLILVVGLARLGLSLLDVPNSTTKYLSLTVVLLLGLFYYSVRVYTSGFGSYKQLLAVLELASIVGGSIIIAGIVIAILTGKDNIFSAPEYSPGHADGKTWLHAGAHVVAALVVPLVLWLVGSGIMWITKKVTGSRAPSGGAAAA